MRKITFLLSFMLFAFITSAQTTGFFSTTISWTNQNGPQTRGINVYVPTTYNASTDYSLMIALHGQGDTPANYVNTIAYVYINQLGLSDIICVAPDMNDPSDNVDDWDDNNDMNGIVAAVKAKIHETYNTDLNRTYLQGFSIGGKIAFFQGLKDADELKGVIMNSPAISGYNDIDNTGSTVCDKDYEYNNAGNVRMCFTAGVSESGSQPGCDADGNFYDLAVAASTEVNTNGGYSIFTDNSRNTHSVDTSVVNLNACWDHLNASVTDPIANFTADNTDISTGQSVTFTDNSTEGGAAITNWAWTFTGGTPSSFNGETPSAITYNTAGTFEVSLTVTNSYGSDTKSVAGYITVSPMGDLFTLDFEASNDYSQNFAPWSTVDVDGKVAYGSNDFEFTGEGEASSFIAMNPVDAAVAAPIATTHGGDRCGMAICPADASASNNWLISDRVYIGTGAEFKFWGLTVKDDWGNESFNVLVSTTDDNTSSFTAIASGETVPDSWTQKTYSLSSYVGQSIYVAIQHTSTDKFMFWVDDIEITGATVNNDIVENNEFKLYPNPASSSITIENTSNINSIRVINNIGITVLNESVSSDIYSINIEFLPSGIYFIEVLTDNSTDILRFVKK